MRLVSFIFCLSFIVGCSATGSGKTTRNECRWNPESCMYDGVYEIGESDYAEEKAKELNRESAKKIRRRTWWW